MPDDVNNTADHTDDPNEPESVKNLRSHAKRLEKELKEAGDARKELAMLKAGIDTDSPLGKFFAENFKGDPGDVEAIKAQATAIGALKPIDSAASTATSEAKGAADTSDTSTQERQDLANGAMPNDASGIDPKQASLEKAEGLIKTGAAYDVAAGELLAQRAQAAMSGDKRVVYEGKAF